ncbi:MAG: sensor histidine kinase [Symbiobacteriia bacterium]
MKTPKRQPEQAPFSQRTGPFLAVLVLLSVLAILHGFRYFSTANDMQLPYFRPGPTFVDQASALPLGAILLFAVLGFVSESLAIFPAAVGLAMGPVLGTVSISSAIDMASLLIFGPFVTMTSSALGVLATSLRNRRSLHVAAYHISQAVLINWAAAVSFEQLRASTLQFSVVLDAPAVIVAISARVVAGLLLDMAYLHLVQRTPLRSVWAEYSRSGLLAENFFIAPIGFLAAVVWYLRPWTVVLVIIPTVANYFALKRHLDVTRWNRTLEETVTSRTADLKQTMGRLRRLHEASLALAQELDLQRTMQVVAEQAARLTDAAGALVDVAGAQVPGASQNTGSINLSELRAFARRYLTHNRAMVALSELPTAAQADAKGLGLGDLVAARLGLGETEEGVLLLWSTGAAPDGAAALAAPSPAAVATAGLSDPTRLADIEAFATQASIALENARLYERTREMAVIAERNRLARELHDSVSQALFSIVLTAEAASRLGSGDTPSSRAMARVQEIAREALAEMRALIFELRPATLQERGLLYALTNHVELFRRRQEKIEVAFHVQGDRRLTPEAELALYRIAQEAMTNVAKHAKATRMTMSLDLEDPNWVRLEVADDGQGFLPGQELMRQTLGLTSMRERAENLGGTLTVSSSPGAGTRIAARVPVLPRAPD